ncbi:hypothetical protein [Pedobacter sp. GR22-6]|uniref:hypothetical protein n=1 Tax=Pedobacter sp. GR22-6 TaxID=3127957 RepID=UPI00307F04C4
MYKKLVLSVLILALGIPALSQAQESVVVGTSRGSGMAPTKVFFQKVVLLLDAETMKPLSGLKFSIARSGTIITAGKTNELGYGLVRFGMNNYYSKVEINMNDNKYKNPEWKEDRNSIDYKPLDSMINFRSKKDVVDTVKVLLRKVSKAKH